jgi:TorA maturation chaperone TorD
MSSRSPSGSVPCPEPSLAELALARRDLYRFLSAAFLAEPSADFLAHLCDDSFQTALAEWFSPVVVENFQRVAESCSADFQSAVSPTSSRQSAGQHGGAEVAQDSRIGNPRYSRLETCATKPDCADHDNFSRAARREFTNLFLVPGGQHIAPYESVFRDTREIEGREISGLLMGQSALDVQQWYRLAALEISADFKELPDHIGLELHYLAYLCDREQAFGDAGDSAKQTRAREMQRDFLKVHVLSWLGDLAEKIRAKAALPLYPAIASLAVEFCHRELATLESALGPSSGKPVPAYAH